MIRLEMKNYNMILIEKQPKYQPYHHLKFVNMNILLVKIYYHLINNKIIEQTKFTYSHFRKAFEKQIKTIEGQGQKQVHALKDLKLKEQAKPIKDKSNNQSKATIIFNELINKRKELMSELYDSVDYNNLNFEYVGPTKNVSFYEYMDSKELFNAIKNSHIKFSEAMNKQNKFLNKLNSIKIGKKTFKQKETINNPEKFYKSREEVINFFRDYAEMLSDANYNSKHSETKRTGLKLLTPKKMLQRLPIALAQVKGSINSESLLIEIRLFEIRNCLYLQQHGMMSLNYQMDLILYKIFKIILSIF